MELQGQVALVTGGAAGLGRHIARAIAAQGAHVVIGDLNVGAGAAAVADIEAHRGRATFQVADVTDDEDLSRLIRTATRLGPLRALVNNAGGWSPGGVQYPEASPSDWSRALALNLRAPMLTTQLCLDAMSDNGGGAVVNIASSAGLGPDSYASPEYGAAKAGLIRFSSCLRRLAAARGVRVSCVVPHWIGLARAEREFQRMSPQEQARSGGLVDPDLVAAEVVRLTQDDDSAGVILAIRPNRSPYLLDPAGIDPYWS